MHQASALPQLHPASQLQPSPGVASDQKKLLEKSKEAARGREEWLLPLSPVSLLVLVVKGTKGMQDSSANK